MGKRQQPDAVATVKKLGGRFAPNLDAYLEGNIPASQIICAVCDKAPCVCTPCPTHNGVNSRSCGCVS